jgi:hypothetical protein
VNLLAQHHAEGRRFEPLELLEERERIAVRLTVTDPDWSGAGETYKVFTFEGSDVVLLEDCVDRDDALAKLDAA